MPAGGFEKSAGGAGQPEPSLPPNYTEIKALLDENVSPGNFVNVIGVVKDCRLPIATSGTDYKSTITLYDLSTEDDGYDINFVIFRPAADMPQVTAGDIIVTTKAKVQRYRSNPMSLITNRTTSIRVYTASKIPKRPQSAKIALAPASKHDGHTPTADETAYVSHIHHKINKYSLPEEHEFQARAAQSLNIKQKFSLLKDVQEAKFYDLVVQVAREPYAGLSMVTLYVSDYTENPHFHPQVWQGLPESTSADGDANLPNKEWVGPYGKMSLQVTCFEPHSTFILSEVKAGDWVGLRNVQIRYGRDGQFLEGFMREERNLANTRINVHVLETTNADTIDPNFKEALRRCRDYQKQKRKQIKEIESAQVAGMKRKASASSGQETRPPNTKDRHQTESRAAGEQKETQQAINQELRLGLNDHVTCETHDAPYSTIETILEPPVHETTLNNQPASLTIPFMCAKYRARVRVVDFFPLSLEDFACSRKQTEYDVLSDNSEDSDCSSSDDDEDTAVGQRIWEWRFALQLEDPAPQTNTKEPGPRPRLWVFVDNSEAQCLTGLDAADLRRDPHTLNRLRQRMFTLWGNLEEHKVQVAERKQKEQAAPKSGNQPRLARPPLQSSPAKQDGGSGEEAVSNKPFTCCIRQYGIHEKERGEEGEWVRCFGLFGTKICG
ncbi:hypothetical protein C8A01DRAFT_14535 [Parachaetomium inaequale]|uniref:Protection of telomeres protein 1 n=1 Tax=Parachaetomium inaequale TaxID=2588326 RepID=A0AAN6PJA9_9PEZI|nr:hypothetical protein C8A01DRAFT_14535 [Parachaetomium inaequale]